VNQLQLVDSLFENIVLDKFSRRCNGYYSIVCERLDQTIKAIFFNCLCKYFFSSELLDNNHQLERYDGSCKDYSREDQAIPHSLYLVWLINCDDIIHALTNASGTPEDVRMLEIIKYAMDEEDG
jgi:hypothetical protein